MPTRIFVKNAWLFISLALSCACSSPSSEQAPSGDTEPNRLRAAERQKPSKERTPSPQEQLWLTDFERAKETAAKQERPILMNFEGSDWCPPCRMMENEVLSKDEFQDFAKKNLVLLSLDFPRAKEQPETLVQQNEALARQYRIEGFPTFIVTDAKGKEIGRMVGYQPGGAAGFAKRISEMIKKSSEETNKPQK